MKITIKSTETGLDWLADGDARLIQNVRNILRMWQGEAAFDRPMGINREALGTPINRAAAYLVNQIKQNIDAYEPDVTVRDVRVVQDSAARIVIEVDIDV